MNTKRPNYFTGQFLKESDFNDDQAYHVAALRQHNKTQHTWGVADGLDVTFKAGSPVVHVTGGTAIDADGKMIFLSVGGVDLDFSKSSSAATLFYVTVEYAETKTDPTSDTGVTGFTRITETPVVEFSETLPADQTRKLVLAKVTLVVNVDGTKTVDAVDTSLRRIAGVNGGELEARSLSLAIDDADKSLWPKFRGLKIGNETRLDINIGQSDFSGQLKVTGAVGLGVEPSNAAKLQVGGALKINGNATFDQNLNVTGLANLNSGLVVTGASDLAGKLTITGDAAISGSQSVGVNLAVGGNITVNGNLDVKGTTTTVNTTEMEISDNIIRVNKYAPQATPKAINGGLEVFRGGATTNPEAQIVWDETAKKWKAGVAGALSEIPIGPLSVDANGNVGIGTTTKGSRLELRGEFVRKIQMVTGLGPNDQTVNGRIVSRTLVFNKSSADTIIRIIYCDNIRSYNTTGAASGQWEIRINGSAPPSGRIYHDFHINCGGLSNLHVPTTILGYAGGIGIGRNEIQIWVGPCTDGWLNNLWTGWNNSRWTIEAQEVWL